MAGVEPGLEVEVELLKALQSPVEVTEGAKDYATAAGQTSGRLGGLPLPPDAVDCDPLLEEDHVDDLGRRVGALCVEPGVKIESPNILGVDRRLVLDVVPPNLHKSLLAQGAALEADLEEAVKRWDAPEDTEHRLRDQDVTRADSKCLSHPSAQVEGCICVRHEVLSAEVPHVGGLGSDRFNDGEQVADAPLEQIA
jgi:hypothetical protein